MLVHHHIKYREIHGVDEVIMMDAGEHQKLHRRLRRDGKCKVPSHILLRISSAACTRRKCEMGELTKATLKIDKSTLERLKSISVNMDDTYDAIITRLLNEHFQRVLGNEKR